MSNPELTAQLHGQTDDLGRDAALLADPTPQPEQEHCYDCDAPIDAEADTTLWTEDGEYAFCQDCGEARLEEAESRTEQEVSAKCVLKDEALAALSEKIAPAPWRTRYGSGQERRIEDASGYVVAEGILLIADSILIEKSPELLAEAIHLRAENDRLRAALAEAEALADRWESQAEEIRGNYCDARGQWSSPHAHRRSENFVLFADALRQALATAQAGEKGGA